ncbi:MAG: carotenoid 1,2-hydratase [Proteobacteria bacterium]|nr:carotenoid 1,2-hydratase [Pseudomonadota bacterium]
MRSRAIGWTLAALCFGGLGAGAWRLYTPPPDPDPDELSLVRILGGENGGFERATGPRDLRFPDDHGPHPRFRTEWWYFTGNLNDGDGRAFGYQLTFFRSALAPEARAESPPPREGAAGISPAAPESGSTAAPAGESVRSAWRSRQIYMAHFTLTDVERRRFHAFERLSRAALGLAGARAEPFRVFLEDWSASGPAGTWPVRLRAHQDGIGIDLSVAPTKPLVPQGDRGFSRKTADGSSASHYYSATRLETRGALRLGGETHAVEGTSWLDREWSSGGLAPDQLGWDWFALQLDSGHDLMWYRLRGRTPEAAYSSGAWVPPDGPARSLGPGAARLSVTSHWRSPRGGVEYPAGWELHLPSEAARLRIRPRVADQELRVGLRYWEGAVEVHGQLDGREVRGVGYVELTGYAQTPGARGPEAGRPASAAQD